MTWLLERSLVLTSRTFASALMLVSDQGDLVMTASSLQMASLLPGETSAMTSCHPSVDIRGTLHVTFFTGVSGAL